MTPKTMTISIPASLREFVEYKADANYGSVSEYIRDLIRTDQRRDRERFDEAMRLQRERIEIQRQSSFA